MKNGINVGGTKLNLIMYGADETLDKLNLLNEKLEEAKTLIKEITSSEIKLNIISLDQEHQQQDV